MKTSTISFLLISWVPKPWARRHRAVPFQVRVLLRQVLLSRPCLHAGLVTLRQTFVRCCHRAWTDISKSRQPARSSNAGRASPFSWSLRAPSGTCCFAPNICSSLPSWLDGQPERPRTHEGGEGAEMTAAASWSARRGGRRGCRSRRRSADRGHPRPPVQGAPPAPPPSSGKAPKEGPQVVWCVFSPSEHRRARTRRG
jgi:hypothetical protein